MEPEQSSIAEVAPVAGDEQQHAGNDVEKQEAQGEQHAELNEDGSPKETPPAKPQKTEAERERDRLQKGIDRRTRQLYEERASKQQLEQRLAALEERLQKSTAGVDLQSGEDEPVSLTRRELQELVKKEAETHAKTITQSRAELEHRQAVVTTLEKTLGKEKFDEAAAVLDDAFGGVVDANGRPKPAMEAVFQSENPAGVLQYLTDPENIDEAEALSRMGAMKAGYAIARIEAKIAAKGKAHEPSKQPKPLDAVKPRGTVSDSAPDPTKDGGKAYREWANKREFAQRQAVG